MQLRLPAVLAVSLCAWLAPAVALAQSGLVQGRVRGPDGTPIQDARVTGENLRSGRTVDDRTNSAGRFAFIGLTRGPWLFTIEKFGYETATGISNIFRSGRTDDVRHGGRSPPAAGARDRRAGGQVDPLRPPACPDDLHLQIGHAYHARSVTGGRIAAGDLPGEPRRGPRPLRPSRDLARRGDRRLTRRSSQAGQRSGPREPQGEPRQRAR